MPTEQLVATREEAKEIKRKGEKVISTTPRISPEVLPAVSDQQTNTIDSTPQCNIAMLLS